MWQLFVRKSCRESQKAERWLKERRIPYSRCDVDEKFPSPRELESLARGVQGWDQLLDKTGAVWKKEGMEWRVFDPETELRDYPGVLKTPLLREGNVAAAGFDPATYEKLIATTRKP